jgi:carbon monoxide dehydrogenase subunit G
MLRALKWFFYLVVVVAAVIVIGSFFLPSTASVSRSITVAAPPEQVFALVSDLKRFREFSPWADIDPNATYSFEGPDSGVGQTMRWSSANERVGSGSQTIVELTPPSHAASELDLDGMGKALTTWDIAAVGGGTQVTWGFRSELNGIAQRWFGPMLDRWVGPDYEKGLARLKVAVEKG